MARIVCDHLRKSYGGTEVVRDFNLVIGGNLEITLVHHLEQVSEEILFQYVNFLGGEILLLQFLGAVYWVKQGVQLLPQTPPPKKNQTF